jgi:hypothetical protein
MSKKEKTKTASEDIRDRQDDLGKTLRDLEKALKKSRRKVSHAIKYGKK